MLSFQHTSKTSHEEGHVFDKHIYILKYQLQTSNLSFRVSAGLYKALNEASRVDSKTTNKQTFFGY